MRKHEHLWNLLKESTKMPASQAKGISVRAQPKAHPRIIKAIIKEKYNDVGFKLSEVSTHKKFRLAKRSEGNVLTFWLYDYPKIDSEGLGL
jgi:predicted GTPase